MREYHAPTLFFAEYAELVGTVGRAMPSLFTKATGAGEFSLDAWIGAIGLVVTGFAAVVALSGVLLLLWTIASEMGIRVAAVLGVSKHAWILVRISFDTHMRQPSSLGKSSACLEMFMLLNSPLRASSLPELVSTARLTSG